MCGLDRFRGISRGSVDRRMGVDRLPEEERAYDGLKGGGSHGALVDKARHEALHARAAEGGETQQAWNGKGAAERGGGYRPS